MPQIDRRTFLSGAAAGAALAALPTCKRAASKRPGLTSVYAEVKRRAPEATARLQAWIRQPSINSQKVGMEEGCALMMKLARDAGFGHVERVPTRGSPSVFATYDAGAKRTLGLYFMYDVKQVNEKEWSSPPFAAKLVDKAGIGKVVMGRAAVNQKGPQAAMLAALHAIRGSGRKPPVNLVLVAEGEEEDGSPHFAQVIHKPEVTAALRRCQGVIMPSASQSLDGTVEITLGSKGVIQVELIAGGGHWARGPRTRDIHSGLKPMVDSPVWHLVHALATLVTPDGNDPAIDGLEAMVRPLSPTEKRLCARYAQRAKESVWKKELGVQRWARDRSFVQSLERLAGRPTVNIQGIVAGYQGPGGKTILPYRAVAKLDLRLVPNMDARRVLAALRAHLQKRGFGDIEVRDLGGYNPNTTAVDSLPIKASLAVYRRAGVDPLVFPRSGGSWPGYLFTGKPLHLPAGHFGLGYGQGAHSKDEFFVIESTNPKIQGMAGATKSYVDFLYEFATA